MIAQGASEGSTDSYVVLLSYSSIHLEFDGLLCESIRAVDSFGPDH